MRSYILFHFIHMRSDPYDIIQLLFQKTNIFENIILIRYKTTVYFLKFLNGNMHFWFYIFRLRITNYKGM